MRKQGPEGLNILAGNTWPESARVSYKVKGRESQHSLVQHSQGVPITASGRQGSFPQLPTPPWCQFRPATLASCPLTPGSPASGPLHVLFLLPGAHFLPVVSWLLLTVQVSLREASTSLDGDPHPTPPQPPTALTSLHFSALILWIYLMSPCVHFHTVLLCVLGWEPQHRALPGT